MRRGVAQTNSNHIRRSIHQALPQIRSGWWSISMAEDLSQVIMTSPMPYMAILVQHSFPQQSWKVKLKNAH